MPLSEAEINNIKGLSGEEVSYRLKRDGFNQLPASKGKNVFQVILTVITEPMFVLLISCVVIYFFLGSLAEALMLFFAIFVIMGIAIYQENKTEKALTALKDLSSPRALVIRDGEQKRIAGKDVVADDIIILREGDRVPADAILLWALNLNVDESLLTGESVSVLKRAIESDVENLPMNRPGGESTPFVFSGTLIVSGQGIARVKATALKTELGRIGKSLLHISDERTNLQKETKRVVKIFASVGLLLCGVVIVVYGLMERDWLNGLLSGLTMAMAILPEEIPVVLTIFLALGAWRLSKKNVLSRNVSTIETLGAASVLCVDKTGTLTQNKMSIKKLFVPHRGGEFFDVKEKWKGHIPEMFHDVIEYGILASKKDPFDPMEKALQELGSLHFSDGDHLHGGWELIKEYPISKELLAVSHVWRVSEKSETLMVAAKGAPEAIAKLCGFSKERLAELEDKVSLMANSGLRVLGVAKASLSLKNVPKKQEDIKFEFVGLLGLSDPVRSGVKESLEECYSAGIRVIMITGDYPGTAFNIAKEIGLKNAKETITGMELEKMSDRELRERVKEVNIFSRVVPEHKLKIIEAFKANGLIVAMTGDGVNDAPALKSANIGIAMGLRGTDVAREASDLVLLDDDFSSIVHAVRTGRKIYDNLKKAMAYIFAVHVPVVGISLIPILLGWPLVLFPVHIVFLELIIDPASTIVFEAEGEEKGIMTRPAKKSKDHLFNARMLFFSLLQGIISFATSLFVFKGALDFGHAEGQARAMAFAVLVISNLSLILTNRSWTQSMLKTLKEKNVALKYVFIMAFVFLLVAIYVPGVKDLFKFEALNLTDLAVSLFFGFVSVIWFELVKVFYLRKKERRE